MVAPTAAEAAMGQAALVEETRPVVPVQMALEGQLVAAVAVLVEALVAVLDPGLGPPEAFLHRAWTKRSPSSAAG